MNARAAFLKWAAVGSVVAAMLIVSQAAAVSGPEGLLQVGESSSLRPLIEEQLGLVPLAPGAGHDGQIYYAIGLDLNGDQVGPLLDHASYRYRRILFPLLASGFGLLEGHALLYGMIALTVAATGLAAGCVGAAAVRTGSPEWLALSVVLNPGVWLSVRLLTSDTPALALMCVGLALLAARRSKAEIPFALSVLAKDVYLVTPAGLALSRDRRRWALLALPLLVLLAWMTWLNMAMGQGFAARDNFTLPFVGLVNASSNWPTLSGQDWFYLLFALISVAAGIAFALIRRGWLMWPILGWSGLALISSNWVWDIGNNAARVFAPLMVLIALGWGRPPFEVQADESLGDLPDSIGL